MCIPCGKSYRGVKYCENCGLRLPTPEPTAAAAASVEAAAADVEPDRGAPVPVASSPASSEGKHERTVRFEEQDRVREFEDTLTFRCPSCDNPTVPAAKFCLECGAHLDHLTNGKSASVSDAHEPAAAPPAAGMRVVADAPRDLESTQHLVVADMDQDLDTAFADDDDDGNYSGGPAAENGGDVAVHGDEDARAAEPAAAPSPARVANSPPLAAAVASSPPLATAPPATMSAYPEDAAGGPAPQLAPCGQCGRKFAVDRLAKHETICRRTAASKRKTFDSTKARVSGTDAAGFVAKGKSRAGSASARGKSPAAAGPSKGKGKGKPKWKVEHENFINSIRQARKVDAVIKAGGDLRDLPPPPPSEIDPSLVQCPHCSRRFNDKAAERHIPHCAKTINRPKPPPSARSAGGRPPVRTAPRRR